MGQSQQNITKTTNTNGNEAYGWSNLNMERNPTQNMSITPEKPARLNNKSPNWPGKGKILVNTIIDEEPHIIQGIEGA